MRILTISTVFPYPPQDGTKIQIYQRVKHLSNGNDVTLLCVVDRQPEQSSIAEMQRYCDVHVIRMPTIRVSRGAIERAFNFLRSVVTGIPYYVRGYFRKDANEWIRREVHSRKFEVVEADVHAGIYLRQPLDALKVWIMHSVADSNERRSIRFARGWMNRLTLSCYRVVNRRYERETARKVDLVAVLTPENEVDLKKIDSKIHVSNCLTNGVDLDYFQYIPSPAEPQGVCFVGKMDYLPNNDAAVHFYNDIWSAVQKRAAFARFFVVGSNPLPDVLELTQDSSVEVSGFVEDVRPLIRKAGVAVVPVRMGGGILNKVLEAMAMGVPVVASRVAVHGLNVESGRDIFVCDDDEQFASYVIRLLADSECRSRMIEAGRQYVETYHKWQPIVARYQSTLKTHITNRCQRKVKAGT
ncbi:MAG: glycosyltransferase [Terracidiphilus sp.]|jgi:glycosyltransferase involved in cell wall biosynthesis